MSGARIVQRRGARERWGHRRWRFELPAASAGSRVKAELLTLVLIAATLGIGWFVWSVVEWRKGGTVSYRLTGLRVVRRADRRPIGLCRSIVRNGLCCTILLVPTILACLLLGLSFVLGASPPDGLLRQPRLAPWDLLTGTEVLDERAPGAVDGILGPLRLPESTPVDMN